jgi:voltage-gated potassium channel
VVAFLTYYTLLILVFACLYRIAQNVAGFGQFRVYGRAASLNFAESLYFSVVTIATVGYGDIVPDGAFVRALAAGEVICGVLLLLFGFSEIMRAREVLGSRRRPGSGRDAPE